MLRQSHLETPAASWPLHGWIGVILALVFWPLNWFLPGLRTHWGFFPLWLGYCLTIDALVIVRKGSSLLVRHPAAFWRMFLISIPAWWLFEALNGRVQNWSYQGRELFPAWQYVVSASLSFSTVMPAVFGTAELAGTFGWIKRLGPGPRVVPTRATLFCCFVAGWVMLALLLLWPRYFFPMLWLALFFILEPLNVWLGNPALSNHTAERDWRPIMALWTGVIVCAFFWEMWNFYSFPKWVYHVPFVSVLHVFEMPLPGYLGYLPFSLELFALYQLTVRLLRRPQDGNIFDW